MPRLMSIVTLLWEENCDDAQDKITAMIQSVKAMLPPTITVRSKLQNLPPLQPPPAFDIEEVLPFATQEVPREDGRKEYILENGTKILVSMTSDRYQVFKRDNCTCVCCGLKGTRFVLDVEKDNRGVGHFNLYGDENGKAILFNKDHIIPTSKNGRDTLDNLQTTCEVCNRLKGNAKMSLEQMRELRRVYDEGGPIAVKEAGLGIGLHEDYGNSYIAKVMKNTVQPGDRVVLLRDVNIYNTKGDGVCAVQVGSKKPAASTLMRKALKGEVFEVYRIRQKKVHLWVNKDTGLYLHIKYALVKPEAKNGEGQESAGRAGEDASTDGQGSLGIDGEVHPSGVGESE